MVRHAFHMYCMLVLKHGAKLLNENKTVTLTVRICDAFTVGVSNNTLLVQQVKETKIFSLDVHVHYTAEYFPKCFFFAFVFVPSRQTG